MTTFDRFGWFNALRDDPKLTGSAYSVAVTIWGHVDTYGEAWPAVTVLAREAKCSVRTVQRALRLLEKNGWVRVDYRRTPEGDSDSSLYVLSVPLWGGDTVTPGGGDTVTPPLDRNRTEQWGGGDTVTPGVVTHRHQGGDTVTPKQTNEQSSKNRSKTLAPSALACPPAASENGHAPQPALFEEPQKPKRTEPGSDADPDFSAFWQAYPRKTAKGQARSAWRAAMKRRADPQVIIDAAGRYASDPTRAAQFTAYPATWLNGERYADAEPEVALPTTNGSNGHKVPQVATSTLRAMQAIEAGQRVQKMMEEGLISDWGTSRETARPDRVLRLPAG